VTLLAVDRIQTGYGVLPVLHDVSLDVGENEIVAIAGPNGAGKTTLLKSIFGLLGLNRGTITLAGVDLKDVRPEARPDLGMALVPQVGGTFPDLTVDDNLRVSYQALEAAEAQHAIEEAYQMFPALADRRSQIAGTLSGGERQMLAFVSGIGMRPRFLALDEPTAGLAPTIVHSLAERIRQFQAGGSAILWIIEENPLEILPYTDRVYVMRAGQIQVEVEAHELLDQDTLQALFFGTPAEEGPNGGSPEYRPPMIGGSGGG
jgi:ABC-type branched-subunit amino acid transport system ATPase component